MTTRRILIAYNQPVLPTEHPDAASEHDILHTVETVTKALQKQFTCESIGYARHPGKLLEAIARFQPEAIFNLFEGEADRTETETANAALLEWMDIPFTGSPSWAIAIGRDKIRTKQLLLGAGLPTAEFAVVDRTPLSPWTHGWPAIVKPACQDSSVGIDQESVVQDKKQLEQRVAYVLDRYGSPVLVERYIPGREFHINVFECNGELQVVPFGEIRFEFPSGSGKWPIYTYQAKWNESSKEYESAHIDSKVRVKGEIGERIADVCKQAFRCLGLRDYGRIDLRFTPEQEPYILEVNPNPYLESPILIDGLSSIGMTLQQFLCQMADNAIHRRKK